MSALLHAILAAASGRGRKLALSDGANHIRYEELRPAIDAVAEMIEDEAGPAGPVAIELGNGIDWVLADLALLSLGRACVPVPPFFTPAQRQDALRDAGVVASVTPKGIVQFDYQPALLPEGTAKISYTSGSTGKPKGICLSANGMLATALSVIDRAGSDKAGLHLPMLPLAVLLENVAGLYATLIAGGTYMVQSLEEIGFARMFDPDAAAMLAAIERTGATSLILVPELLGRLLAACEKVNRVPSTLRLVAVGGAHISPDLLSRADRIGLPLVQGYGLTECGSVVAIETPGDLAGRGSVGRPLSHVQVTIEDDGEIVVDGNGHLGLVGQPRPQSPIRTGDIGRWDAQGRLVIDGRKSNLIVTGFGRNVSPEWVETLLKERSEIAQAMVYGDGEAALSALIVPSSLMADVAPAIAAVNADLPDYARLSDWRCTKPFLPVDGTLTANGRLRRGEILAREEAFRLFDRLVLRTLPARARLLRVPQIRAGLAGNISRATYSAYLAQAYHHVRHTVPLMQEARARLGHRPALVAALDEYIEEETGHEHWILNDIAALGEDPQRAVALGPSPATKAMVDHAYRTIREGNPASFFGMVYVLESTSIALASQGADALRTSLNLPSTAFSYLQSHGALDQDHMRFFQGLMDSIEDPDDATAIIAMADRIFDLFGALFATIPMEFEHEAA
ncbi:AMP-binding protein [Rhizorhabdus sp. FW153]|uniref:AMP-binding protein n=1 Tax=Rhizorhabdus sp. FW153 TaxID=3400216 RepID=UPI003CEDF9F4